MKLWLVRHAQPLIGAGICYGVLDAAADAALTAAAASSLAVHVPQNTVCRISPLRRCQQLAAALAQLRPDLSIESSTCTDQRLTEMDFGEFEGQAWATIPKAAVDAWTADFGNHRFGGKECANDVLQRVKAAIDDSRATNADNVLWITHAGVIRAVDVHHQGIYQLTSPSEWPREVLEFGCYKAIDAIRI
jgi:alpha-ribazole phosphatase